MSDEEVVSDYHDDVQTAINDICDLAQEKNWTYMVLLGACQSLAASTKAVLASGLAKEWDKDGAIQGNQ